MSWEEYKTEGVPEIHHPERSSKIMSKRHANFLSGLVIFALAVLLAYMILDALD